MADRRRIEERIRKKEQEIQELESQLREARIYVQALQDVLKMFPKGKPTAEVADAILRSGSMVARAREAIMKRGKSLHILEILKEIGKEPSRTNQIALGGSLSAYVRKGKIFTRPAPNTFGLLEIAGEPESEKDAEPPPDFGIDDQPDTFPKSPF